MGAPIRTIWSNYGRVVTLCGVGLVTLLGLLAGNMASALADGGGFPTLTPTPTSTSTPTATPLPTPTSTLEPSPIAHAAEPPNAVSVSTSSRPSLQIICWPLAVGLILIVALVIVWVMGRQQAEE